jgi:Bacterial TniB protein
MNAKDTSASKGFNAQDPFQNIEMHIEGLLPPPPIVRIEGWQYFVQKPNAIRPAMPTAEAFGAMGGKEKKEFAKLRKKFHSEMPLLETPALSRIHAESIRLAAMNYSAAAGARMGIVLDGLGTVGKSSIAMELGKKYELSWRKNILPRIQSAHFSRPIPVVYVTLPGILAINDFNRLITSFMGISVPASATVPWLNDRIIDAMQQCGTSLVIIDDIHFLQMRNRTAQTVNNHLKFLASCVSATFVYAGINVEGSGLLAEGNSKEKAFVSQTQHRFKTFVSGFQ